jgi:type II secretory pathway component PulF
VALERWRYSAEDARGAVVSGVIAAQDAAGAKAELQSRQLTPLRLEADRERFSVFRNSGRRAAALTMSDMASVTSRLRDLLTAGLPLAHVLRLAGEQAQKPNERGFLLQLLTDVRAGRTLSEAIARNDFETPRLFKALVEAGENLGTLDRQMDRLATHYDETLKLRREILAQLAYPIALVVLMIATLLFLSFLVLPQFESIFQTSNAKPPPETEFVLACGAAIRAYWPIFPVVAVGAVMATRYLAKRFAERVERARLATPIAGKILLQAAFGGYLRTLSTLLGGGASITKSMPLARQTMSLSVLRCELEEAETAVKTGERLAPALKRLTSCPKELISFVEIGEETGDLARLTGQAATSAETRVRQSVKRFMALLAPALTALMGLLTAGVIASVMTGVLSLNETIY